MMESATGLILRTRFLTESSLIVEWLTRDLGRIATVAKGARRATSPFRGKLDLFYVADLSLARSRRSDLHTLREVRLAETHEFLRRDLGLLQQAAYCAGLIEQATETETPVPELYDLVMGMLQFLPGKPAQARTVLAFELRLLEHLGLAPNPAEARLSPGSRELLRTLAGADWCLVGRLQPSESQALELDQFLHGFILFHLGRIPRGRSQALRGGDVT